MFRKGLYGTALNALSIQVKGCSIERAECIGCFQSGYSTRDVKEVRLKRLQQPMLSRAVTHIFGKVKAVRLKAVAPTIQLKGLNAFKPFN